MKRCIAILAILLLTISPALCQMFSTSSSYSGKEIEMEAGETISIDVDYTCNKILSMENRQDEYYCRIIVFEQDSDPANLFWNPYEKNVVDSFTISEGETASRSITWTNTKAVGEDYWVVAAVERYIDSRTVANDDWMHDSDERAFFHVTVVEDSGGNEPGIDLSIGNGDTVDSTTLILIIVLLGALILWFTGLGSVILSHPLGLAFVVIGFIIGFMVII